MTNATFIYTRSGVQSSRSIEVLYHRGMSEPDEIEAVGPIHDRLDGVIVETVAGARKHIQVVISARSSATDRRFLADWVLSSDRTLAIGSFASSVVLEDGVVISEWLNAIEKGRRFTLRLVDDHIYHDWADGAIVDENMYCKLNVLISGDSLSPETFTTGTSPLALMETTETWPVFNSATHVITVVLTPNSSCQFIPCLVGNPTVSAGNVVFQAFVSDFQTPASDGFYYMDVRVFLQTKP